MQMPTSAHHVFHTDNRPKRMHNGTAAGKRRRRWFQFITATMFAWGANSAVQSLAQSPNLDSAAYQWPPNPFGNASGFECTRYAWGRAYELTGVQLQFTVFDGRDGGTWYWFVDNLPRGSEARANSIADWRNNVTGQAGHVGFVESVDGDNVTLSDANRQQNGEYDGTRVLTKEEVKNRPGYTFNGYIYVGGTPPQAKFQIGRRIQANSTVNVRDTAGGSNLGQHQPGDMGTVVAEMTGATYGTPLKYYQWWEIDWDAGADGWSVEDALDSVPTTPGAYFHPADCWLYNLSGYSASFFGSNPTLAEVHDEIRRLATAYDVPVEIIAAVVFRESGLYQWGSDGYLAHNKCECESAFRGVALPGCSIQKPPGLGLCQLTGDTAKQFNVNRLIADWPYNLESGVKVLAAKFEAALQSDPSWIQALERANRRVLENWIYALEFYHGYSAAGPSYSEIILGYIANPPSRLVGLFTPVNVTRPSQVVPGFAWGAAYVAQADGTWRDASAGQFSGVVHVTSGSPPSVAPIIVTQPASQIAALGGTATFSVAATGSGTLSYQWRHNGAAVGPNSPTLTLTGVTQADSGAYVVVVTGSVGSRASDLVTLTVNAAGAIRIIDGLKRAEPPPYFIGETHPAIDVTIKNFSGTTVYVARIQVDGDPRDAAGNLLDMVSWNAENFSPALALAPNATYRHVASLSQPLPFNPAKVAARLKVKFDGIPGLQEVTDAEAGASAVLAFETLDKYELTVDASPYAAITKTPDFIYYGSGTQLTLKATPTVTDMIFKAWKKSDGSVFSEQNPVTITMTKNLGLRAEFAPLTPRINVWIGGGTAHLTWPDWGTAFLLEMADTSAQPLDWQSAGVTAVLQDKIYRADVTIGSTSKIFRLRRPLSAQ